ncbi:signal recognition particle-docking protein FtsY [Companilactobacillus huachuanensis]|uniref:Signal recognition particle receptor FtsY n=1 Tax=Companilactobacillus huachuanensis TaxID=2559914 RepID=A0ABW1RL49_9LACO|nr:signal recognition particle-docking protein FtsY [Companilactobacillus huachuanensis]
MGLFDRIKKAFTGKDDSEDKDLEKKSQEESEKESDQTAEANEAPAAENSETTPEVKSDEAAQSVEETPTEEPQDKKPATEPVKAPVQPEPVSKAEEVKKAPSESEPTETEHAEELREKPTETENKSEDTTVEEVTEESSDNSEIQEPVETEKEESESTETTESEAEPEESAPKDDVQEYDEGLKKSRNSFSSRLNHFLANFRSVDEDFFDDLEELLIESDVGYETAMRISDELREEVKLENAKKQSDVSNVIVKKLVDMYGEEGKEEDNSLKFSDNKTPTVFLFVGVNGAGKTTTVGKLAHRYKQQGKKVLLAAADTFRAGAIEQLQEWGKRDGVDVQASKAHTDPASVVYDAVKRAMEDDYDILLVDTAGRLQNKEGLMRELEKIKRVITRELPDAPQEVLLVLDGSTGQNALSQAKQFNETTDVSGIVLTKLDGSSQGGVVLAIRNELHIPVKLVGLGEQMDDLRDFDPEKFIYGLFKDLIVGTSNK